MSSDDKATEQELANLEYNIQHVRNQATLTSRYKHTGYCLDCFDDVDKPKLFCNGDCAGRFEKKKGQS